MSTTPVDFTLSELDFFENLVLSQQPATEPWTPVTDYSFEARKVIEGQHPQLIKDVFQPRTVTDVGAGPGHLVRLLQDLGIAAYGYDVSATANDFVCFGDITADEGWRGIQTADLVLYREVNEHLTLRQIRRAVTNLCAVSTRWIYGTTRFSSGGLLDVETRDALDPSHITLMSKDLLRVLFNFEGFRYRSDLAERMDWKHFGRTFVFERAA